jgi:VWFA-related protein
MRLFVPLAVFLATLPASPPAAAQDPVIRVDVELVNVYFTVRNKANGLVANLSQDQFEVFENGKKQEIKFFAQETDQPLTIGLLIDVSRSQENLIGIERRAAAQFFNQVLRPKDSAFLISFGAEVELLQDSTGSAHALTKALDGLRVSGGVGGLHPGPVPNSNPKGTVLYDAVYLAANEKMRTEVGRKALIVITDGMDFGSTYKLSQAIEEAHKADTIIYGIWYYDPYAYGMFGGSDSALKKMAEETGGRSFHADRKNPLEQIFAQIEQELRSQYVIGYSSSNPVRDGSFRRIEIKTRAKDLRVQARKGYYATSPGE